MNQRVAVERGLSQISQYLRQQGCEVEDLSADNMDANNYACCVISGGDKDMMGIQNVQFQGSVINAEGMTADEVYQAVQQRIGKQ
ncbi:YkuS family protein [Desmospora activa]|uniref:Uncharacterized protein UPF0180 n=1 Tax=Desmospora activa DSM 45169 TaxID=1121389 RepID=A0A2T4ZBS3_9BACL|nr:YkuS family protein [Desmospora activa]PTM59325.1 uncharacterized protein UPF0180 [Desmospora activa DSM 45169]